MIHRWLVFAAWMLAGAAAGYGVASFEGVPWGGVLGATLWQLLDSLKGRQLLQWLRLAQSHEASMSASDVPKLRGVWGEAADRIGRLLRKRDLELRDSRARLDEFLAAMQASPNGVVLLDAEGRIEWCNQMAAQHFGFDAQRDVQQHIANLVREPAFKAYLDQSDFSGQVVIPGHDSTPTRPLKLSVHLSSYGDNRKLLLSRDITAVEQAEAMRRDFVANVSHEIRTPLTVVAGFIETLQSLPLKKAERDRYLALMAQQSQRMQTLVNDLLTLSRLEGSPLPGTGDWVAVNALFEQCEEEARALSNMLVAQGHELSFESFPACEIAGNASEIRSAFSNLVTNAVRYTPEAGLIAVSWKVLADGRGEFRVRDSGPGIAPEHLPRLTERFYRVDRSRSRESGGTGLGLAIVKHVAQRHGAELQISSQPGQGSCFVLVFPAARVRLLQPA